MRTTLYRAMERNGWTGQMSCWTEESEHAEAYQDNPGFGGPVLYSTEVEWEFVLDLTGGDQWQEWNIIADELEEEGTAHDMSSFYSYVWDVWEGEPNRIAKLERRYDWIRYEDNYPDGCVTWVYLGRQPIAAQEVA